MEAEMTEMIKLVDKNSKSYETYTTYVQEGRGKNEYAEQQQEKYIRPKSNFQS